MNKCLQRLHSWKRRYPASDARVLGVVFDSDGQPVLSHSLSVQGSVHLHDAGLLTHTETARPGQMSVRIAVGGS